jgi:GNAT superfamily N-acetyltransferase/catechol 2,3-dioxygenase-like lactoylglutathione lyase family enzyme
LFREYAEQIGVDLCFEGFDDELEHLDRVYGRPRGVLWVAWAGRRPVGCVGLRPYSRADGEMKRLYVRTGFRGSGLGRRLVVALLARARALSYQAVRLDTLPTMQTAQTLYRSLGFRPIPPYKENPVPGAAYLRLPLGRQHRRSVGREPDSALPRFVGLHHVQLSMPSGREADARAFYGHLLGLPEIPKPPRLAARGGVWFRCGGDELHLGADRSFRAARRAHPAWVVHDLPGLRRRLTHRGVPVETDRALPGFRRFYALDPFGNRLEFLEPSPNRTIGRRARPASVARR